jgi:hypothetical protein
MSKEETSGMSEHPAEPFDAPLAEGSDHGPAWIMVEKTSVTDPECNQIPEQLFTSTILKNFASDGSEVPDLVLHRGSAAVPEYNNLDHIPGMYPTLFPLGAGGFDFPNRECPISFAKQANCCLDFADKSFRYHHSFMFVVLKIIQRRTAHLQTHSTVQRSR